ncbi:lamin-like protein [Telopea speciosissima]|uniref:lamin-like protein n=1 Tax=Telopea speciosissima TaxID=54955 RepID=UPI001CC407A2|nr:lamin-like protein [Telopea speciosissima]
MFDSGRSTLFCFLLICSTTLVGATDHIVGANKGWNPGINYTLWANNHTFYVGDLISFRYVKTQYNVFEVNETGYDNCTIEGATGNWSSGKDFILLNNAKRYYFICGTGGCFNGMKVSVLVHTLPPPPHAANAANVSPQSSNQAGFQSAPAVLFAFLASLVSIWFNSK